ncbi:10848_t:CDS:2 [Paraglomus occultum]|uniref:10848_t:CDS:1 n=1 Tax=Paraglomus occultum TaxID=144539 RepID=A0A9N8VIE8_9GLOM|nr:10848_t:CDS:2 [Paraglomus occultum]
MPHIRSYRKIRFPCYSQTNINATLSVDGKAIILKLPSGRQKIMEIPTPEQIIEECKGTAYTAFRIFHRTLVTGLKDEPYRPYEVQNLALKSWRSVGHDLKTLYQTLNMDTKTLLKSKNFILDQWCKRILHNQNQSCADEETSAFATCSENFSEYASLNDAVPEHSTDALNFYQQDFVNYQNFFSPWEFSLQDMGMYRAVNFDVTKLELHLSTKDYIDQEGSFICAANPADINDTNAVVMQDFFNPEDPLFAEFEYLIIATENNYLSTNYII